MASADSDRDRTEGPRGGSRSPVVFVLDDDPGILSLVRSAGSLNDWIVETFTSVDAFLGALDPERTNCVLLDYQLADETGLDALAAMEEREVPIPVILMSGIAGGQQVASAFKAGVIDFLEKPFDLDELRAKVGEAIARSHAERRRQKTKEAVAERWKTLSPRERQVVNLVVDGLPNKDIAAKLGIAQKTVEVHRSNASAKLRASNVAELVRLVLTLRSS